MNKLRATFDLLNDPSKSIEIYQQALDHATETGSLKDQGKSLNCLGKFNFKKGNYKQAFVCHEKAVAIYKKINDPIGEAINIWESSLAIKRKGDLNQAIRNRPKNI